MRFRNRGKELHEFALVRIGKGHTVGPTEAPRSGHSRLKHVP